MKIKVTDNHIEVEVWKPISKVIKRIERDEEGNKVPVQYEKVIKEIRVLHQFDKYDVGVTSQYITERNTVSKRRCVLFCKSNQNYYYLAHSYEELKKALERTGEEPKRPKIGFV